MNKYSKKSIVSWAMYDWANSAFATTVIAGFFPIFFKEYWSTGVEANVSTARLGFANSIAGILVAIMAPILGAIADKGSVRKKFLMFFTFMGIVMTLCLFLIGQNNWLLALFVFAMATIGFSGANIFYDALLCAVAPKDKMDRISALGYSLGYLGGGLLFAANIWMVESFETFGFSDESQAVRFAFVTVGVWWAIFSIPIFLFVKEPTGPGSSAVAKPTLVKIIKEGLGQLKGTFMHIRQQRVIFLFLLAYWFYIDGVDTIVRMAVDYGMSINIDNRVLITSLLLIQFVGFPAALGFGYLGTRIGTARSIFIAIGVYLFVTFGAAFIHKPVHFYVLAVMIGLVQGGIQALSRSYFARLIPEDKSAEYFGFYNMLGKFAVVIGPALMGLSGLAARKAGYSVDISSRISIVSIALLFIIGATLFYFVNKQVQQDNP